jgi:hypothetical protein
MAPGPGQNGSEAMKQVKIIKCNLSNELSIRAAEKAKTRAERTGYNLISQDIGMFSAKFIYTQEAKNV